MMQTIERHRHLIDFALAALMRRKGKNLALVMVYTLIVFLLASVIFFTNSLKKEAALILRDAPEIVVQRSLLGRYEQIPLGYGEKIREIRGVSEVRQRLWGYYYDPVFQANYTFMVPHQPLQPPGTITLGAAISRQRGAYEGDIVTFQGVDGKVQIFQISAVLSDSSQLVSADLVLVSEEDYRQLAGMREGFATDLTVRARNPKELATIAGKIRTLYPDSRPILRSEILRTYEALFNWRSGITLLLLATCVLSFLILAWDKATGLSAEEQREIGILKAVGWETSDILILKFWEGLAISLIAFLLGGVAAYGHIFIFDSPLFSQVLKGWSTLYPSFRLIPYLNWSQITILFALTVPPYAVATIVPAWRAATIDPGAMMR